MWLLLRIDRLQQNELEAVHRALRKTHRGRHARGSRAQTCSKYALDGLLIVDQREMAVILQTVPRVQDHDIVVYAEHAMPTFLFSRIRTVGSRNPGEVGLNLRARTQSD
jgi:hypothetical protein